MTVLPHPPLLADSPLPDALAPGTAATHRGTALRAAVWTTTAAVVLQPFLHPTGPGNSSPVDAVIVLAIIASGLWASGAGISLRAPYTLGVGLMVVAGAAAGLTGPFPGESLLALVQDLVLILWCTVVTNLARQPGVLRILAVAWAVSAVCWAAVLDAASVAGLTAVEGIVARDGNRALFTFGDPNYAATFWVASVFVLYAVGTPGRRWLRWLGYLLLAWALLLSESNGGVLELLLGCGALVVAATLRRHGLMAATALVLVASVLVGGGLHVVPLTRIQTWALGSGVPFLVNSLGRSDQSSAQRGALIDESLQLYAGDGLLGSGPSTTKQLLSDRQYGYAKEAHDDYLAALVERGPLGVLGLFVLIIAVAYRAWAALRSPPSDPAGSIRSIGLIAALLAMALAGTYYEVLHFRFVWLLLALIAAAASRTPASGPRYRRPRLSAAPDTAERPR